MGIGLFRLVRPTSENPLVLAMARDVSKDGRLLMGDLTLVSGTGEQGQISDRYLERVVGAYALRPLRKGEMLRISDIEWNRKLRNRIPKGALGFPLALDSDIRLNDGDRVDLYSLSTDAEQPILEDVLVLDARNSREPVLAVEPADIGWVEMAKQRGKLRVAVRSSEEPNPRRNSKRRILRSQRNGASVQILEEE